MNHLDIKSLLYIYFCCRCSGVFREGWSAPRVIFELSAPLPSNIQELLKNNQFKTDLYHHFSDPLYFDAGLGKRIIASPPVIQQIYACRLETEWRCIM